MSNRKHPQASCETCPFFNRVGIRGRGTLDAQDHADLMIIGDAPNSQDVINRQVFSSDTVAILVKLLKLDKLSSFWMTNASLCFGQDSKEREQAASACQKRLEEEILQVQPKLIITMGNIPTKLLLGKGPGITKRRGQRTELQIAQEDGSLFTTEVLPTVHPSAVIKNSALLAGLESDLNFAYGLLNPSVDFVRPPNPEEIEYVLTEDYRMVLQKAQESTFCVLDIETNSLDPVSGKIILLVMAPSEDPLVYLIPQHVIYSQGFSDELERTKHHIKWSGHETKFDRNFIRLQLGVILDFSYDTLLAHFLLDERQGTHGAKEICAAMFRAPDWDRPVKEFFVGKKVVDYSTMPKQMLYTYTANDGYWQRIMTWELHKMLKPQSKLVWVYKNLLIPGVRVLSNAEAIGIRLDKTLFSQLIPKYEGKALEAYTQMCSCIGHEFNPRSPQQVSRIMFDELGLPEVDGRSTNAKTVLAILENQHEFVKYLLDYREAYTISSRYVTGLSNAVLADGRVHTRFNLAGTVTGRLSSSNP